MRVAREAAARLRVQLGLTGPMEARAVCAALGVPVDIYPFRGTVRGVYWNGRVAVRTGLSRRETQHVILHEVGHHLLHGPVGGAEFWLRRDPTMLRKFEGQAEDFAYFFALPGDELCDLWRQEMSAWEVGERYGRTYPWLRQRVALAHAAGELDPPPWRDLIA